MPYELNPRYPLSNGRVDLGYSSLAGEIAGDRPTVVAIDGPEAAQWGTFIGRLSHALHEAGLSVEAIDVRVGLLPWPEIERRTMNPALADDPVFATVFDGSLRELFERVPQPERQAAITLVHGPGSALVPHDRLWYIDFPKRLALAAAEMGNARNIGQVAGSAGTARRMMFIDWPLQDRHKQETMGAWERYIDLSDADRPRSVDAAVLRRSLRRLATVPFRPLPSFLPQPWGGQWLRRQLRVPTEAPNLGISYELITPESGLLLGDTDSVEVGFEVLLGEACEAVLGPEVVRRFGMSFPIRFDYLDTVDGGNLSVHCHPRETYMRKVFGLPYTQHETYYVMVTQRNARIFLGLREGIDVDEFRSEAERSQQHGQPLELRRYVPSFPAKRHQLYLIPGGTPHGSGKGNVVLEISATPYVYSLRFYDWLRVGLNGQLRPVQLHHAFQNLNVDRRGAHVRRQLIQEPTVVRSGRGFTELQLGRQPELFFGVHRLDFRTDVDDDTAGRFHVLNLVEGDAVVIETASGATHPLSYAETIVVPAAVGRYRLRTVGRGRCRLVKAFVLRPG
jgi:hypothetical protein